MVLKEIAERLLTVPYVENGKDMSGIDCWGVIEFAHKEAFGVNVSDRGDISPGIDGLNLGFKKTKDWSFVTEPLTGDIVLFNVGRKKPGHVGLVLEDGSILHAEAAYGVSIQTEKQIPYSRFGYMRHVSRTD